MLWEAKMRVEQEEQGFARDVGAREGRKKMTGSRG